MESFCLPAPAKLNLFLRVINRRKDGYHNIQTLFQFIDYCDELSFSLRTDGEICLDSDFDVPPEQNLVYRAAKLLQNFTGTTNGANLKLKKNLPISAGIGGGSSDAATTLWGLNQLWKLSLPQQQLLALALQLGSDVPIFIYGHAAQASGRGEIFSDANPKECYYLLLIPDCHVSTAQLFQDKRLKMAEDDQIINSFLPLVRANHPPVAKALDWLNQFSPARLSGTGGVVFAAFDTHKEASTIAAHVPADLRHIVVKGQNESPLQRVYWGVAKR